MVCLFQTELIKLPRNEGFKKQYYKMLHHSWAVFFHSGAKAAFVSSFCVSHGNFDPPSKSFVYLLVILQDDNLFKLRDCAFIVLEKFFFGCYLFRIKNGTYPQFKNHTRIQKEIKKHLPQISLMRSSYFWH